MKNDQEGIHKIVPRHVYANSFNLQLCPLGALAQYFKIESLLAEYEGNICHMGYGLEDLGIHSICKAATTYASPGSIASSGGISISIWGG
eukprot:780022-Ditylum_brightwellii.AAC.1